jgi:hypothetical protein
MSEREDLTPDEVQLEAMLRRLAPVRLSFDPIAAVYEAGRNAPRASDRLWRAIAGIAAIVAAAAWLMPSAATRSQRSTVEHLAFVTTLPETAAPTPAPAGPESIARLEQAMLLHDLDGLGPSRAAADDKPLSANSDPDQLEKDER